MCLCVVSATLKTQKLSHAKTYHVVFSAVHKTISSSLAACQQLTTDSINLQLNLTLPLSGLISNLTSSAIMIASANPIALVDMRRTQYKQYLERIVRTVHMQELRQSIVLSV